jgi:hypothetical protein
MFVDCEDGNILIHPIEVELSSIAHAYWLALTSSQNAPHR